MKQTIEIDVPDGYEIDHDHLRIYSPEYDFDGKCCSSGCIRVFVNFKLINKTKKKRASIMKEKACEE